MDARDALDQTLQLFDIKAVDLAEKSGIDAQMISKYRRKHKDMTSLNLQRIVAAMPEDARFYFLSLFGSGDSTHKSAKGDYSVSPNGT